MKKYKLSFKEVYENTWELYLENTKTNIRLRHTPMYRTDGKIENNLFDLYYICNYTRSEKSLIDLLTTKEFKKRYNIDEIKFNLINNGNKIEYGHYIDRITLIELTENVIGYLINYHMKENIEQIIRFRKYVFPISDIVKKLK